MAALRAEKTGYRQRTNWLAIHMRTTFCTGVTHVRFGNVRRDAQRNAERRFWAVN